MKSARRPSWPLEVRNSFASARCDSVLNTSSVFRLPKQSPDVGLNSAGTASNIRLKHVSFSKPRRDPVLGLVLPAAPSVLRTIEGLPKQRPDV